MRLLRGWGGACKGWGCVSRGGGDAHPLVRPQMRPQAKHLMGSESGAGETAPSRTHFTRSERGKSAAEKFVLDFCTQNMV